MSAIIKTPRLVLRAPRADDLRVLVTGLDNFNVSQWTARIPFPYTMDDAEAFLAQAETADSGTLRLAVTLDGGLIGGIACERSVDGTSAEIGYWLAEPHWGKGYATEAARAISDHAFEAMGYDGLKAGYRHGNEASRRILEGLGFIKTGDGMMFSRAVGSETPVTRLQLTRAAWEKAKDRRR